MNNIFINNNDIDGLHFGSSSVSKVYFGSNLVYEDTPTPPTPSSFPNLCYGVTDDISTYTETTFSEVYDTSSNKWYMLNNFNQYEEYGVIEEVSCETTPEEIPTYIGKLVNYCDGSELECVEFDDGFPMYDSLGMIETITEETEETITIDNTSPSPLIGTTFPTNFKIAKTSFGSNFFTFGINGTNGESLTITNNPWSPDPVNYNINNNDQTVYDDGEGYYVFESNEADFEIQIVNYYESTPINVIHTTITEETIYPKEYDEKSDPDNYITFDTMEEAYAYEGCVYVGIVAIIGGDGYVLNDNYEWEESQSLKHLNFTATNGDATIGMMTGGTAPNISYSFDKETWTSWDFSDITIPNGSTLYMKGTNNTMNGERFTMSGSIAANGNIMSLLYGDNFIGQLTIPSNDCFYSLFSSCMSLTTAPILPATTLESSCYNSMFYGCTSLTSAPELPATTLAEYCYGDMFRNCTSLTSAPILPATTLVDICYNGMFYDCSNLNYIKMMATDISASVCLDNWVYGVAATGTFVKNANATWNVSGDSGVPNGWTIEYYPPIPTIPNYLNFTAKNGSATIGLDRVNMSPNVSYSFDGTNWTTWDYSSLTIQQDETVYFKGNNPNGFTTGTTTSTSVISYSRFAMTGTVESHGNVMSLLYDDNFEDEYTLPCDWCFAALFSGCTSLTTAPELPATGVTFNGYRNMFINCTSLTTAPSILPATTLAESCYQNMFHSCTSLTSAPTIISATTLAVRCFQGMFVGCTSLTTAPILPATTLVSGCYGYMFSGCTSLNYIKAMFTTTPSTSYTNGWVSGVGSSGTYVKNSSASYTTRGASAIPTGWTIQTASS